MKTRSILIFMIILVLIATLSFTGACKDESRDKEAAAGQENIKDETSEGETKEVAEVDEEASDEEEAEENAAEGPADAEESSESAEEETIQEGETEKETEIPEELMLKIEKADGLFGEGLYAEASKEYRNAQIAIDGSDLPDEVKEGLLESIYENYNNSQNIIENARMHHNNAMNLIYEKRYEEAEAELRAALEIYPKYQTAIEALESLEDIKGLQ